MAYRRRRTTRYRARSSYSKRRPVRRRRRTSRRGKTVTVRIQMVGAPSGALMTTGPSGMGYKAKSVVRRRY